MNNKSNRKTLSEEDKMILKEIGDTIYQFRIDTRFSRKEFGKEYHISHTVLEKIENGDNYHIVSLMRVLRALELDLQTIIC